MQHFKADGLTKNTSDDNNLLNSSNLQINNGNFQSTKRQLQIDKNHIDMTNISYNVEIPLIIDEKEQQKPNSKEFTVKKGFDDIEYQLNKEAQIDNIHDGDGIKSRIINRDSSIISLLEDEYFGEDDKNKQKKRDKFVNPESFSKLRDHHASWDTKVFFEIWWYHILYYLIIGPLINIFYFKRKTLMKNLQFQGNTSAFFLQTIIFFFNACIIILYFTLGHQNIYFVEILFTFVILILRSFVIACKQ